MRIGTVRLARVGTEDRNDENWGGGMADNQDDRIPEDLYGKIAVDRNGMSTENQDSKMAED